MLKSNRHISPGRRVRHAFTLVELLIVVAIIVILLSLLIVGLNLAKRTAQGANTRSLMTALNQGVVRFKEDTGYYPPVLDQSRRRIDPPAPTDPDYDELIQDWVSIVSPAEYLVGWDENTADGYGSTSLGEVPFTGIRDPGPDGVWGAGFGGLADRNPVITGKPLGPYLSLENSRLLLGINPAGNLVSSGEDPDFVLYPKVVVDIWGQPIEYYRRTYPAGAISQSFRALDYDGDGLPDRVRTLSDVIALRPYTVSGGESNSLILDANNDPTTSLALDAAEFAFLSKGPNQDVARAARVDDEERNRDNLVEIGP